MISGFLLIVVLSGALVLAGFVMPHFVGDRYHYKKWRLMGVFLVIGYVFILLTPHGCTLY